MSVHQLVFKNSKRNTCFCAFCKSPRRIETKKHLGWINVGLSGLFASVVMWVVWFELNPKAIVIFVMALVSSEIFIQIRWRLSLACPHCQFDPLVYLKNPEKASIRVRQHFETIQDSPKYVMGFHPLQKVMLQNKAHAKAQKKSRRSSRLEA